jgi:3',5'-cyclic AMP phosphodiesterase CpdA
MTLIAQISDLHLVPRGTLCCGYVDTNAHAERAVEAVNRLIPRPDAVVVTGDVIETTREDEYEIARDILARLEMPFYLLSGNHDSSAALKRVFRGHGFASSGPPDRLTYAADIGRIRLIVLDSSVPGASHGAISTEQLAFLDRELVAAEDRPSLVALHHPPIATGHKFMDSIGLRDPSQLAEVIGRHRNVVRVLCGHCHRTVVSAFAGTIVSIAPSTAHQLELALDGENDLAFTLEPPAFLLHRWSETEGMATHQVMVERFPGPYPFV